MASHSLNQFRISGAVLSMDKYHTPHYIRNNGGLAGPEVENQDYGLYVPDVGLLVADGLGASDGGAMASRTVVDATVYRSRLLGLASMPPDEAVAAVREDILPFADGQLADVKQQLGLETACTTLGALLLARGNVIAVGIGDTPAFGSHERVVNGQMVRKFGQLTVEHGSWNEVYNPLSGDGRPTGDEADEVWCFPMAPNQRFLIASDGLLGDAPTQRLPEEIGGHNPLEYNLMMGDDPEAIVERLSRLPARLDETDTMVVIHEDGRDRPMYYVPKDDDLTIGAMLIRSA